MQTAAAWIGRGGSTRKYRSRTTCRHIMRRLTLRDIPEADAELLFDFHGHPK